MNKFEIDAAFDMDDQSGASGAIIRDCHGVFVAASCRVITHMNSASMAGALAMQYGLELANSIGRGAIEVESDALEVIQYCTGEERMWNEATAIYANCLSTAGSIGKVDFVYCLRDCKKAAHSIARYCFNSKISCNWVDDPPSFIAQTLIDDVTII
jgi:hypothetical protein